jgi:hypothetical protein
LKFEAVAIGKSKVLPELKERDIQRSFGEVQSFILFIQYLESCSMAGIQNMLLKLGARLAYGQQLFSITEP